MQIKRSLLLGALLATAVLLPLSPASAKIDRSWSVVQKTYAGLPSGSSFLDLASNGDALLLAGESYEAESVTATIWRSEDGLRWEAMQHPQRSGMVNAIAVDGDDALAIGGTGFDEDFTFVWQSADGGRTWTEIAHGFELFGMTRPDMGRPFVGGLLRHHGSWIASGGRSDGYAAIWISRDGARWRQVLGDNSAGSATVVKARGGSLLAYWTNTVWYSEDGAKWTDPSTVLAPRNFFVSSVATGARVAVADDYRQHGQPTPLLRSNNGGSTWKRDRRFLDAYPEAAVWKVARGGGLWVAAGTSGRPNHVDAWVSANLREWFALPSDLYGGPGGTLSLIAAVGDRIVVMGTAPELERYYVLD